MDNNLYYPMFSLSQRFDATAGEPCSKADIETMNTLSQAIVDVVHPLPHRSVPIGIATITLNGGMIDKPYANIVEFVSNVLNKCAVSLTVKIDDYRKHVVCVRPSDTTLTSVEYIASTDMYKIKLVCVEVQVHEERQP